MAKQSEGSDAAVANGTANGQSNGASNGMGAMGFGDIGMIRNILMGQHISEFEAKFNQINDRQDKELANGQADLQSLEAATNQRLQALEKRTEDRFALLEAMVKDRVEMLQKNIAATSQADKHALGKLLGEISNSLLNA
jgi:hypothetical protein